MSARNCIRWACATILIFATAACSDAVGPTTVGPNATEVKAVGPTGPITAKGIGTSPTGPTRPGPNTTLGVGTSPRPQP